MGLFLPAAGVFPVASVIRTQTTVTFTTGGVHPGRWRAGVGTRPYAEIAFTPAAHITDVIPHKPGVG